MEYKIENLSPNQIELKIAENSAIILPVSAMEPFGNLNIIGLEKLVVEKISEELALKSETMLLPIASYSPSTPFRAFPGAFGMTDSTFYSFIRNIVEECSCFGINRLVIVNGSHDVSDATRIALKKIRKWKKKDVSVIILNWQRDLEIIKYIESKNGKKGFGRFESAMLSLFKFISAEEISISEEIVDEDKYKVWSRRNRDPEVFGKLYPNALKENNPQIDPIFGKELFDVIINRFVKSIETDSEYLDIKSRDK